MITVAIVDDHPIVRAGMRTILEASEDILVVAEGGSGGEALRLVEERLPNVLVLDINLPDQSGIEVTRQLRAKNSSTAILILTAHDDAQLVFELLENGAIGYVLKDEALEMLANAVRAAASGKSWLSPTIASQVVQRLAKQPTNPEPETLTTPIYENLTQRELEILCLLAEGLDNTAIAEKLTLTKRTVQNHISNIYGKLGVTSRTEAMLYALRHGLTQVT
jgi:two-component system, NarL family, response regulator DegU